MLFDNEINFQENKQHVGGATIINKLFVEP